MPSDDRVRPIGDATDVVAERIAAQIVDVILLFVQTMVVGMGLVLLLRPETRAGVNLAAILSFSLLPIHGGLLEAYWNGQTVGKRLTGVKVVDFDGRTPSLPAALFRNLPAVVIFSWVTTAVALAAIATSDDNQRVFDRPVDTYVVAVPE